MESKARVPTLTGCALPLAVALRWRNGPKVQHFPGDLALRAEAKRLECKCISYTRPQPTVRPEKSRVFSGVARVSQITLNDLAVIFWGGIR